LTPRVFVYGTLRRGGSNHRLLGNAHYLGLHHTAARYTMYRLGPYPGVVEGGSSPIRGEVYAVGFGLLQRIDRLEDYPRMYRRVLIPSPYGRAWIYLYQGSCRDRDPVIGGDWLADVTAGV
jgi:gamma-glutamylcyclotransferase (GGCT)/AIG2-like uncharacterized protein YtfP